MKDYRKLCIELFGTDDETELRKIADDLVTGGEAAAHVGAEPNGSDREGDRPGALERNVFVVTHTHFPLFRIS